MYISTPEDDKTEERLVQNKPIAMEWKIPDQSVNERWNGLRHVHTSLLVHQT